MTRRWVVAVLAALTGVAVLAALTGVAVLAALTGVAGLAALTTTTASASAAAATVPTQVGTTSEQPPVVRGRSKAPRGVPVDHGPLARRVIG